MIINSVRRNKHTFFNLAVADFPNQDGGTLKAKALGEFGDIRVYATNKEISEGGDALYTFDTVVCNAHR